MEADGMLAAAELGRAVEKQEFDDEVPGLRVDLLKAQYELRDADFPVFLLLGGDDRVGLAESMRALNEWMDPRSLSTHALGAPTDEERERPEFWRYWRLMPRNGRIALFMGGWTLRAIIERLDGKLGSRGFLRRLEHIRSLERMLVDDGALVVKLWLHLSESELRKRLRRARKHPRKAWRIHDQDWQLLKRYDKVRRVMEDALHGTSIPGASWEVVESDDARYRDLTVARTLLDSVRRHLAERAAPATAPSAPAAGPSADPVGESSVLDAVDLSARLDRDAYPGELQRAQRRLHDLARSALEKGVSTVLVFEGWDAAGKGGVIRRLTAALDPPTYRVIPIAAPTSGERAHNHLWRFWVKLPRAGHVAIFDRSWYGRVLVERVEAFARPEEWRRAYEEINDFESSMTEHGWVVQKFWLHIDPDEQLRRFQARETTPFKKYKITEEDYRNREKREEYLRAVDEMVARTSTPDAPWELVAANDKRWARIHVIRTVCRRLEAVV